MGNFKITRFFFKRISKLSNSLGTIAIASIGAAYTFVKLKDQWIMDINTIILYAVIFFLLVLVLVVAFIIVIFSFSIIIDSAAISVSKKFWLPNFIDWLKKPQKRNLHISKGELYKDTFTLKFKSTEWRYSFSNNYVLAFYEELKQNNYLRWKELDKIPYRPIKRGQSYEINFIKVNSENNNFYIIKNNETVLGRGSYSFKIIISSIVNTKYFKKIKCEQEFFVIVIYRGANDIFVEIAKTEKELKKIAWKIKTA